MAALSLASLLGACSATGVADALTPRAGTRREADLAYGPGERGQLDLYWPPGPPRALLVFFYGGGWRGGAKGDYAFLARVLAARGLLVAVPDYRIWPAVRWPAFVEDGAAAVAWLLEGGAVPRDLPVFLMGHSAGGFIAGALALDPRWLGPRRGTLAGCVTLAAPFAWVPQRDPLREIFATAPDGAIRAAPDEAALATAPPMLLLHGADDTTVRPDQSRGMAARLAAAGAQDARLEVFPGTGHVTILSAMAAPVRALGLARAPVLPAVTGFLRV